MAEKQLKTRDQKARDKLALNIDQRKKDAKVQAQLKAWNLIKMEETQKRLQIELGFNTDSINEIQLVVKGIQKDFDDPNKEIYWKKESLEIFEKLQSYKQTLLQKELRGRQIELLDLPQITEEIRYLKEEGMYYPRNTPLQR